MSLPSVLITAPFGSHSRSVTGSSSSLPRPPYVDVTPLSIDVSPSKDGLSSDPDAPATVVCQSLSEHGVEVFLLEGVNVRKDAPGFERALRRALAETGAGVILPIFYPEALAALASPSLCDAVIPLDTANKIRLLDNKLSASRLAASLGVQQPHIYDDPAAEDLHFPVVFKRALGQGGDSVYFPRDRRALDRLLATAGECLVQDFIPGENVSVDALRWDGFFYAAAYRVLEPSGKGISRLRESIEAPSLVAQVRRLLDSIDYHGVCGVDFRVNDSGSYFLECNPRFSGGVASAVASGFDIPYLYYRLALGLPVSAADIHFTPGIRTGSLA